MDKDIDRALKRFHLTAKITGRIAREAGVKNLLVMHFSPKYRALNENPEQEAMEEFRQSTFLKQGRHSAHQTQMN
jgi:ribonuclease Z